MIEPTQIAVAQDWTAYAARYGVPSALISVGAWLVPKAVAYFKGKWGTVTATDDLTRAGVGGMNDVVNILRTQMGDLTQHFKDLEDKLTQMSVTLDKAVSDKLIAQQDAAKARSDLYVLQLYVERLLAQIKSLGATPVQQP